MSDAFFGGVMLMYVTVGIYVWALGLKEGWLKRKWLGLLLLMLIWPLFLADVKINMRR